MKHKIILLLQPQHNHALRIVYAFWRQKKWKFIGWCPNGLMQFTLHQTTVETFYGKFRFILLFICLIRWSLSKLSFFIVSIPIYAIVVCWLGIFCFRYFFFVQLLMLLGDIEIQNRRFNIAFFLFELREKKQKIFQFHIGNCKNKVAKLMNLF